MNDYDDLRALTVIERTHNNAQTTAKTLGWVGLGWVGVGVGVGVRLGLMLGLG